MRYAVDLSHNPVIHIKLVALDGRGKRRVLLDMSLMRRVVTGCPRRVHEGDLGDSLAFLMDKQTTLGILGYCLVRSVHGLGALSQPTGTLEHIKMMMRSHLHEDLLLLVP